MSPAKEAPGPPEDPGPPVIIPAAEKAAAIVSALVAAGVGAQRRLVWIDAGVRFTILLPRATPGGTGFAVEVEAAEVGRPVELPLDNPYEFINPPLMVPTGTTHVEQREIPPGSGNLEDVEVPDFVRDELAAAKDMIRDAVLFRARQMGWTPP